MNVSQPTFAEPENSISGDGAQFARLSSTKQARGKAVSIPGIHESPSSSEDPSSTTANASPMTIDSPQTTRGARWTSRHRSELQQVDPPKPSSSKKRTSSKSSATGNFSPPAGPPSSKKPHYRHRSPRELHSARSTRSTPTEQNSHGPLFFSDEARSRPALPYRLSSSEAGAKMLGKGHQEEMGVLKTVKLARGAVGVSSPARPSGHRTPSGSGRSHFGAPTKSKIPENGTAKNLGTLIQGGVIELLDQDDRPTFVLDLKDQLNYDPGPLKILFANASLKAVPGVCDTISGVVSLHSPSLALATPFSDFKAWCISYVKDHEPLDVVLPLFNFAGAEWTCSSLRKQFRVFRGVPLTPKPKMTPNPASLGMPAFSPMTTENEQSYSSNSMEAATTGEEPQDYFGNAGSVQNTKMVEDEGTIDSGDVGHGLRISKLTQPLDLPVPLPSSVNSSDHLISDKNCTKDVTSSEQFSMFPSTDQGFFDWTRLADSPILPKHIQFAKNVDWASTSLGPIEGWSSELRSMCNLVMASPHPAAMYWGPDFIAIYNEAYIYLAGQKHPMLMGQSYKVAWAEIWDGVKDVFESATTTGESTMKEDDCLFIQRAMTDGSLEEVWFDWSIVPLVGGDGSVVGLYNPAFEKTKRKVGERRMGTLSNIGERTSTAKDLKTFWTQVIAGLEANLYDAPFALLYSVGDGMDSDSQSSIHTGDMPAPKSAVLEGSIGVPSGHPAAALQIDLRDESESFARVFRDAANGDRPIVLSTEKGTLDPQLLEGLEMRGHPELCISAVCCPVQSTRNETLGYLVIGINPRRPYDDDYSTFIQMLGRQISTAVASVVLFEEEIRAGMRAKRRADLARRELSEQLAVQTAAAVETERKFTQMAKFAPVGIFIADSNGIINYRNEKWYEIMKATGNHDAPYHWMDAIKEEDQDRVERLWSNLVRNGVPMSAEVRFKSPWIDQNGNPGDTWVLASGYPEKDEDGKVKVIFGSITDISQQKWAEHSEKRRMEEAVEMKRQQENFIDITSHEMRNPLSAILQCADEINTSLTNPKANDASSGIISEKIQNAVDAAGIIALCAQHQKRIVDDILTLSKLDSALLLVTPCDVMPKTVVQRALKMFDGELQTADIKLNFQVNDSVRKLGIDWVKLDPSRLLQVLINLTTNAIKFTTTQEKRSINVTLGASLERPSKDGPVSYFPTRSQRPDLTEKPDWGDGEKVYMHFAVEDTGRGLTDDEKKLLFLRFSQTSPRTHVQYGGSGLGLFISRELVELQGGEIGVASTAGEGSTFAFYVKARRSSAPKDGIDQFPGAGTRKPLAGRQTIPLSFKGTMQSSEVSSSSKKTKAPSVDPKTALRVLIVEDNLVNQTVLARQLQNLNVIVHVANHGGECLDRLKESTFWKANKEGPPESKDKVIQINVILMDQEMPIMDGLTCTRAIREMEKNGSVVGHVPIISVTANARSEQLEIAKRIGMDDVVSKPFRIPDLIPKIEELVAQYPAPDLL